MKNYLIAAAIYLASASLSDAQQPARFNTDAIKFISCTVSVPGGNITVSGSGTVFAKNEIMTAYHVVNRGQCSVDGYLVTIIKHSAKSDIAIIGAALRNDQPIAHYSCSGFLAGQTYYSFGFSSGMAIVEPIIATMGTASTLPSPEYPYEVDHLKAFSGLIFHGMSGGPVIDNQNLIIGINNGSNVSTTVGSRSLSDTPLCSNQTSNQTQEN